MNNVIIIAEAGVNHNGSLENAFKLVDCAKEAGADYIKFQTFKADKLVTKSAQKVTYQTSATGDQGTQYDMLKSLELSEDDHDQLLAYCNAKQINFFSTGFDIDALRYLRGLGLNLVKIPSGEITNLPYLREATRLFDEVILSTGMATLKEVEDAVSVLKQEGIKSDKITILHCTTEYPAPLGDVNLRAMNTMAETFQTNIGYSDHTEGIEVSLAAVALGATVIEKHFTLDKTWPGPDHKASLEPDELKMLVKGIRNIELALSGDGVKAPSFSELNNIEAIRKSIVAKCDIKAGEILSEENLTVKRPGKGISPMRWDEVINTKAVRDFQADSLIVI